MNLQEQIYRSRKLMIESHDDKLSLILDILNDFLSFNGTIQFNVVLKDIYGEDDITYFNVEIVVDSSLFHMVSPNYNPEYNKHLENLNDEIEKLIDRYFGDEVMYVVMVYFHKNVDVVLSAAKPMLDKAMKVYSQQNHKPVLRYKFISSKHRQELVIYIEHNKEIGQTFSHTSFIEVLNDLYYDRNGFGLFDDFYITGILGYSEMSTYLDKIYESVDNNKVICDNCGWSWDLSDGDNDPYTCHKCSHENKNPHV